MRKIKSTSLVYLSIIFYTILPYIAVSFFEKQREEDFVFVFLNACILFLPFFFIKKSQKLYYSLLSFILLLPASIELGHALAYQGRITASTFFIIFDTNTAETLEFLDSVLEWEAILLFLLYWVVNILLFTRTLKQLPCKPKMRSGFFFILFILTPFAFKFFTAPKDPYEAYRRANHPLSFLHYYEKYRKEMKVFSTHESRLTKSFKVQRDEKSVQETYVLIIGESTTRNKMSLYGYQRDTTPRLKKFKKENTLYVFNNVVSSAVGTLANLKRIVTFANAEDSSEEKLSANLVNLFKTAGFKTFWISNQLILGLNDTITSVFARQADNHHFTNTTNSKTFDEKVLPILDKYLEDNANKKLIVIHLIGTHMKYRNRFPKEYIHFQTKEGIELKDFHNERSIQYKNDYDNSVLYHDYVLTEILNRLKRKNDYAAAIYLSDHGEEVYDTRNLHGHPGTHKTLNLFEIPFLIWVSENYRTENNFTISNKKLSEAYVSDDLIHTLLGISGVYSEEYIESKNVLSKKFLRKRRESDTLFGI